MLLNLFCILVFWNVCFFYARKYAWKSSFQYSSQNNRRKLFNNFFILIVLYSLFNSFGGDVSRYKEFVEGAYLDAFYYDVFHYESIYVYLASISHGYFLLWKFFVYGLTVFITYYSALKYNGPSNLIILIITICILPSYGITRGVLAYSIYLLGVNVFYQQKFKYRILGVLLIMSSYAAHTSMIVPILLFPLSFIKLTPKKLKIALCLAPVFITIINNVPLIIESVFGGSNNMILYKFNTYSNEDKDAYNAYRSFLTMIYGVIDFVFIIYLLYQGIKSSFKNEHNKKFDHLIMTCFMLAYISILFKFSDNYASAVLYQRYFTMIPFFIYFIVPYFYNQCDSKRPLKTIVSLGYLKVNFFFLMELYYGSFK